MQSVMEQWREYTAYKGVFENTDYITRTLGIELPVSEGDTTVISEELRSQIIKEHLLFEGFLDSMKKWVKDKAGEIPNLFKSLYKIMKEPSLIKSFSDMVLKKIIRPLMATMAEIGQKAKRASEKVGQSIVDASQGMYNAISSVDGWKALVVTISVAVLLKKAVGMPVEQLVDKITKKLLGTAIVQTIISQLTDFSNWLSALAGPVGGVAVIAGTLAPATEAFLQMVAEGFSLNEKATSKAQQKYFGMLKKCKEEGDCPDEEMRSKADKMTTKQIDDFAGTKHKGLPDKVKNEELRARIREAIVDRLSEEPAKGKKYSKTVTNKKTGRKKKVSYGAKGYRIAPGTSKGDSYCARSYGIKKGLSKDKQNDPNTPNNLSRKKWKCRGKKSMKEEFTTEEIRMVIEDVIGKLEEAGKCQKGYKTHPTRKTKEMFGKQYRNCVKADEELRARIRETIVQRLEEEGGCYSDKEICTAGLKFVVNSESPGIKDVKCEDGVLKNWSARAAQIASKYCKDDNYGRGKKDESKEDFKPHKMYDPETGEGVEAKTHQDHIDLGKKGYVHEKPKIDEGDLQKWADEKWTHSDGTPCGDGRGDGSVERCKPKAKWAKMSKGEKAADNAKKRAGTKKGKQNVSATKKGKVTKSYTKR